MGICLCVLFEGIFCLFVPSQVFSLGFLLVVVQEYWEFKYKEYSSTCPPPLYLLWHLLQPPLLLSGCVTICKLGFGFTICLAYLQYVSYLETGSYPTVKRVNHLAPSPVGELRGRQLQWNTLTTKQHLCITSSVWIYFVLSVAGTGCSRSHCKQEHTFIHDRLQMWEPHLD